MCYVQLLRPVLSQAPRQCVSSVSLGISLSQVSQTDSCQQHGAGATCTLQGMSKTGYHSSPPLQELLDGITDWSQTPPLALWAEVHDASSVLVF